ncbi:hypothetical protein [Funiculus sociatus]
MVLKLDLVFPMTDLYDSENVICYNKQSLTKLVKAIALSQGDFSLILVSCNNPELQEQVMERLREISEVEIQEIVLYPSVRTLYTTIEATIEDHQQPQALMVYGLDSVVDIHELLSATNHVRNEFRKRFTFPLVLWVSDEILLKVMRLAPDFKSWATKIRFEVPKSHSIERTAISA